MCGIAGFLCAPGPGRDARALSAAVTRMTERLIHRGPDGSGEWVDAESGLALGHRRLSVVDLSPAASQPMVSPSGRYVLSYNGEIYNFRELRARFASEGAVFRGHGDTETLCASLDACGVAETLRRVEGMFAFAVWDAGDKRLTLARDRFGEKPLYYGSSGGAFLFASELKALRAHPEFREEIDRDALREYFRRGYVPGPLSIYRGICKLPPGCFLSVSPQQAARRDWPEPEAYWSAADAVRRAKADPFRGGEEEAVSWIEDLLRRAVSSRLEADVPLGAFLSGGIDSSLVVAMMQTNASRPVRTFSVGFAEKDYDESASAAAVARHLGAEHAELRLNAADVVAAVPGLAGVYDEPFADSSQIPAWLLSRFARRSVTVALSGDGGDEVFGGYNRHVWGERLLRGAGRFPMALREAASRALLSLSPSSWDRFLSLSGIGRFGPFRQRQAGEKIHKLSRLLAVTDEASLKDALTVFWREANDLVPGPAKEIRAQDVPQGLSLAEAMMWRDAADYLPDDILVKVDRASMAVSLETRAPFLDSGIFAAAWRLPFDFKVRQGRGKRILRKILGRYVPEELTERPKSGFAVPLGAWLRGELREWAESLLSESALARDGLVDPAPVAAKWREHLSGARDHHQPLWAVLMYRAWREGAT